MVLKLGLGTRGKIEALRSLSEMYGEVAKASGLVNGHLIFEDILLTARSDLVFTLTEAGMDFRLAKSTSAKLFLRAEAVVGLCAVVGQHGATRCKQLAQRVSITLSDAAIRVQNDRVHELHELFMERAVDSTEDLVDIGMTEPICVGMARCFFHYYCETSEAFELKFPH